MLPAVLELADELGRPLDGDDVVDHRVEDLPLVLADLVAVPILDLVAGDLGDDLVAADPDGAVDPPDRDHDVRIAAAPGARRGRAGSCCRRACRRRRGSRPGEPCRERMPRARTDETGCGRLTPWNTPPPRRRERESADESERQEGFRRVDRGAPARRGDCRARIGAGFGRRRRGEGLDLGQPLRADQEVADHQAEGRRAAGRHVARAEPALDAEGRRSARGLGRGAGHGQLRRPEPALRGSRPDLQVQPDRPRRASAHEGEGSDQRRSALRLEAVRLPPAAPEPRAPLRDRLQRGGEVDPRHRVAAVPNPIGASSTWCSTRTIRMRTTPISC